MSETTEVNRAAFGQFLNQLRREKGWTQKDLAERLYVSDKAVSKWERGLSLPDVALLLPLAGALGVSVTELLEGHRAVQEQRYSAAEVEALIRRALAFPVEPPRAPTGPGEAVSARIPHLLRAGRGRGAGGLDAGAGPHRDGADLPRAGRGVWRDLRSLCFFLDDRDAAPLL